MKITLKRTDNNTDLFLDTDLATQTGAELKAKIADLYDFNPNLQIVHAGKIIGNDDDVSTLDNGTVIIVKWKRPLEPGPMFQGIKRIAAKNPYFLSYLAVKPAKALEILEQECPDLFNALPSTLKNN